MATLESDTRELPVDEIVSGAVPLATLRVSPGVFANRLGIEWATSADELGEHQSVVLAVGPSQARVVLMSYESSDPPEITLLGHPDSGGSLDEILRTLRVSETEVFDRVDQPVQLQATRAVTAPDLMAALEESLAEISARVDELQVEAEMSRLASLASIEGEALTPRQRQVLERMVSGLTAEEVAEELGLTRATVLRHLNTIRNSLVHQR